MKYIQIALPYKIKSKVLAFGAQSKASFCFAKGNKAYLFDLGVDLEDLENFKKFEKDIKKNQKKLKIIPKIIAYDLHPEYISTKYAKEKAEFGIFGIEHRALSLEPIQHHEAHVASCMVDNNIKGSVIGVTFDGTGFGADGNIWGGEFFVGDVKGLKRAAHLKYVPMPGGEAAVKEPWRMAFSYLRLASPGGLGTSSDIASSVASSTMTKRKWPRNDMLSQIIDKKINSPLTSSMGRLFDGVSSLIGVCDFAGYEGEAAIKLEKIIVARGSRLEALGKYKFKYTKENGIIIIDWEPVIKGIVRDLERGIKKPEISLKFHNAVCDMIKDVCISLRKKYKIKNICMSGGVFQNKYLIGHAKPMLEKAGFDVYSHKRIPTHDGGIAIGQAILAGA